MNRSFARIGYRLSGFSLLEMAVALVIVGLLLGGLLSSLATLQQRQREERTERQLAEIRDALTAFAVQQLRLPCPAEPGTPSDVPGAGIERPPTPTGCAGGSSGVLPWATLGLPEADAWGRRFSYRVTPGLAAVAPAFTLASVGDNVLRNGAGVVLATAAPAVVVSHGRNAAGSRGPSGAPAPPGTDANELENTDGDEVFVAETPTAGFDDLVVWVPTTVLMHRLLAAGRLP